MSDARNDAFFVGSKSDPSRAEPLGSSEYNRLCAALETVVLPEFIRVATALIPAHYRITKADAWEALASLEVRHRTENVDGWLRFQIHRSFGPLLSGEPVFWSFALRCDSRLATCESGRLSDLDATVTAPIADRFLQRCQRPFQ
jgi:hypothetical protein